MTGLVRPLPEPEPPPGEAAAAPSPASLLALVADKLEATEAIFRTSLDSDVPFIRDAGTYLANGGGKRVRPALLLLVSRLLGHDSDEEVTYAAVVELIHTATLIHDDIIDHADVRRGRATVNQLWGNHKTVLLGDWIYALAMEKALDHDRLEVVRRLVGATRRMVEGELLALERLGTVELSVEEYFHVIERKTANLFSAACSVPALIAPCRPDAEPALASYGRHLGLCFQIVDDLLDFTARQEDLGKPVLSDLKEGKLTLPLILLLPRLDAVRRRLLEQVIEDRNFQRTAPEQVLEMVTAGGTLDEAAEMARRHAAEARRQLEMFPLCDAREALEIAPELLLERRA